MIYRDEDAMLDAHPLTALGVFHPSTAAPARGRRGVQVTRSALIAVLLLILVGTFLGHDLRSDPSGHPLAVYAVFLLGYTLVRATVVTATSARSGAGELLSPARTVAQINAALLTAVLFSTFLLPGAPATTVGLFLLLVGGRLLMRRFFVGSVPVRRTPGGLLLRTVSPRYRRALTA